MTAPFNLQDQPIHLGLGARAQAEPSFANDMAWYEAYIARHAEDGREGRLVSVFTFTQSWDSWEMHPQGDEVVMCLAGALVMHQETPTGVRTRLVLKAGEYAINAPGVWHTVDVEDTATALFITAGLGTQHRPR